MTGKFFHLEIILGPSGLRLGPHGLCFGSVWIEFWSVRIVCLEIVGPRPPLIQLSTDIRGSWIKGGLGSSPFAPILCLAYCDGNL